MKISIYDMSTLHRMIGIIEGAVFGMGKREGVVYDAIQTIDEILDKAEVERCVITEKNKEEQNND